MQPVITDLDQLPDYQFPPINTALNQPNGLLAFGGDLHPERLLAGYRLGIFPWFGVNDPILWWSPDPRAVFYPDKIHCAKRLQRKIRRLEPVITHNKCFADIMRGCAAPRPDEPETWLHGAMQIAYSKLHQMGHAHSIEAWLGEQLIGGVYGVGIGKVFFAESMFSAQTDGSKIALLGLSDWLLQNHYQLIDTQMLTPHLQSLGAVEISRSEFQRQLQELI